MKQPFRCKKGFDNIWIETEFRLLRCFMAVVQCGGFSAAEALLDQDTSAISRQIRELELRLGFTLCKRGRSGFSLTPEGSRVYASACELFGAAERFKISVGDIKGKLSGELSVGLVSRSSTNPDAHIEDALAYFRQAAPEVQISINFDSIDAIHRGLLDGRYHVGVVPDNSRQVNIEYVPLFSERNQIYVGVGHDWFSMCDQDISWGEVANQYLSAVDYQMLDHATACPRKLTPSMVGGDLEAVALMVLSGQSLGLLPDHYAQPFVEQRRMRPLMPERTTFQTTYFCVYPTQTTPPRSATAFRDALIQAHGPVLAPTSLKMPHPITQSKDFAERPSLSHQAMQSG